MLHVLAAPDHHPDLAAWAAGVRAALPAELSERLLEAEFLWRSSRADFLIPARPRPTLAGELDDVDRIEDEAYVTSALVTTCGSSRLSFTGRFPAERRRGARAGAGPGAGPGRAAGGIRRAAAGGSGGGARAGTGHAGVVRRGFFDAAWPGLAGRIAADLRRKADLRDRQGSAAALGSVSAAVSLEPDGEGIVLDKSQDNATSAAGSGRHVHAERLRASASGRGARTGAGGRWSSTRSRAPGRRLRAW